MRGRRLRIYLVLSLGAATLTACAGGGPGVDRGSTADAKPVSDSRSERPIDISKLRGKIVFSAGPTQKREEIFVVNADGSRLRRVTHNSSWDFDPAWSPDGRRIVFRSQRRGNDEIRVMNVDGTRERNISRAPGADWGPDWSPDGSEVAFNSDRDSPGRLLGYVVDARGGTPRMIGDFLFEYPAWSPDGRRLLFMHQTFNAPGGNYEIAVVNRDGSDMKLLTDEPGDDGWPQWSPDGNRILFSSIRDDCAFSDRDDCEQINDIGEFHALYVMNADGTEQTRITEVFAQFAVWSPDGKYILFTPAPDGFYVMRPDGSGLTSIPVEGLGGSITLSDWTF